jgi:hypothetical protein
MPPRNLIHRPTLTRRNTLAFLGAAGTSAALGSLLGCGSIDAESGGPGGGPGPNGDGSNRPGVDGSSGTVDGSTPGDGGRPVDGAGPKLDAGPTSGHVGTYAGLNLQAHAIYSIDMALKDYPQWTAHPTSGEVRVHETGTWWDGGDALRTHPPTEGDRGSGIGSIANLWRNATFVIRELNFRFEWQAGPEFCSRTNSNLPKFVIAHSTRTLNPAADAVDRPMLYLAEMDSSDNPAFNRADTLALCPAQGTVRSFSIDPYSENGTYYPNQVQSLYFADNGGTFQGKPVVGSNQIVTIEMRMLCISTPTHPRGLIAVRTYLRNGQVFERGCPWNWNTNSLLNVSYLYEIQMFGGGYYNRANVYHPNNYTRVGGLITLAANYGGWLGPRPGFVV